jgi:hypothetical protein
LSCRCLCLLGWKKRHTTHSPHLDKNRAQITSLLYPASRPFLFHTHHIVQHTNRIHFRVCALTINYHRRGDCTSIGDLLSRSLVGDVPDGFPTMEKSSSRKKEDTMDIVHKEGKDIRRGCSLKDDKVFVTMGGHSHSPTPPPSADKAGQQKRTKSSERSIHLPSHNMQWTKEEQHRFLLGLVSFPSDRYIFVLRIRDLFFCLTFTFLPLSPHATARTWKRSLEEDCHTCWV